MSIFYGMYSFFWVAVALTAVSALILLTRGPKWNDYLAFGVIVTGLFTAWVIIHPRQTVYTKDANEVRAMIGQGTPVLLEFQSPFCLACTAIKPVVDGLEDELGNKILIIRLNVQDSLGRELAPAYGFEYTPTFIFFDAEGREQWRQVGGLDAQRVRNSLIIIQ
jgi:thioredoxin 1